MDGECGQRTCCVQIIYPTKTGWSPVVVAILSAALAACVAIVTMQHQEQSTPRLKNNRFRSKHLVKSYQELWMMYMWPIVGLWVVTETPRSMPGREVFIEYQEDDSIA